MSPKHQAYIKCYKQQIKMNLENFVGLVARFQKPQLHSISIFFKLCPSVTQLYFMYYLYLHLMFKVVIFMFHSVWWHFLLFEV